MFYYAIYVTRGKKTTLLEKHDYETTHVKFVKLFNSLPRTKNARFSAKNNRRVLSSFYTDDAGHITRYVFRRFKKRRIAPSAFR